MLFIYEYNLFKKYIFRAADDADDDNSDDDDEDEITNLTEWLDLFTILI